MKIRPSTPSDRLKEAIRKEVRLMKEDLFGDEEEQAPAADQQPPQAATPPQAAPPTDNKVNLKKVSGTSSGAGGQEEEMSLEACVEKLNSIRSGRSFKDDQVLAQMESYYNDLKDAEKKALQAFLSGISQIVTAGVEGQQAEEPSDPPHDVSMVDKKQVNSKQVKPNVVTKGGQAPSTKPAENTSPPVNVKQR